VGSFRGYAFVIIFLTGVIGDDHRGPGSGIKTIQSGLKALACRGLPSFEETQVSGVENDHRSSFSGVVSAETIPATRGPVSCFFLTVTDFGGIYRRPHVHSEIRWPQVLFQKQVIAKSLFLDLLTREAGKASHMTVNLSKEPLFEGQTGLSPQNP
jgi:hypothetical protein